MGINSDHIGKARSISELYSFLYEKITEHLFAKNQGGKKKWACKGKKMITRNDQALS